LKIENHTKDFARYIVDKSLYGKFKLNFQIRFIEQTNLRKYWSWVSVRWCFLILVALYIVGFSLVYWKSTSFWLSGALASVGLLCPLVILDTLRQYNDQRTRGEMIHLLSLLGQWYIITEDVIKSFEKASEHQLAEPLSTYIDDFVVQVHSGFEVSQALDLLNRKVESNFFNLFIVNIDQAIKNRGDVGIMLKNLEDEAYQLQEEFNRRKMSMVNDKIIIYCTMLLVLMIGYHFLVLNEITEAFYFHTDLGRGLVVVFCILYLVGFFIAMGLSKLEY
jgi:membrane protein YdbS with pleckstrin-like domain